MSENILLGLFSSVRESARDAFRLIWRQIAARKEVLSEGSGKQKRPEKISSEIFFRSLKTNFQFRFFLFFCQFFALLFESLVGWHFASKRPKPSKLKTRIGKNKNNFEESITNCHPCTEIISDWQSTNNISKIDFLLKNISNSICSVSRELNFLFRMTKIHW